jgi:LEA14-like dessication related protein
MNKYLLCKLFGCLLIITITLLSCSTPKALEYRDFQNFRVEKLGFASSQVKMDLVYFNPNNFDLQLKRTEVDIYIDGILLGTTAQDYQITIPKKRDFSIPLSVDLVMKNLIKNGWNAVTKKEVTVKVAGRVKVGKANVFINFPLSCEVKQQFSL